MVLYVCWEGLIVFGMLFERVRGIEGFFDLVLHALDVCYGFVVFYCLFGCVLEMFSLDVLRERYDIFGFDVLYVMYFGNVFLL